MQFPARIYKLWVSSDSFSFSNILAQATTHTYTHTYTYTHTEQVEQQMITVGKD